MKTPTSELRPIAEVAADLGLPDEHIEPYGRDKAKIRLEALKSVRHEPGKLILVSAITPTPAGEGKTTTSIGLASGLRKIGRSRWLSGSRRWVGVRPQGGDRTPDPSTNAKIGMAQA